MSQHVRYARASVDARNTIDPRTTDQRSPGRSPDHREGQPFSARCPTLWASRPFVLKTGGRLVAVRLLPGRQELEVLRTSNIGAPSLWVKAERVLSEREAELWAQQSKFTRAR